MPNPGDFDPARAVDFDQDKAIRQQRAAEEARKQREEAEKQRVQAQRDLRRANILKLLRYADEQLEDIRNPIVSEFVITEMWWKEHFFGGTRQHERHKARYYGSWLALSNTYCPYHSYESTRSGLVKLPQPRAGYAYVTSRGDWDPRNTGNIIIDSTDYRKIRTDIWSYRTKYYRQVIGPDLDHFFRIFASLEEATERYLDLGTSVEDLTKAVKKALDFVATGQPPEPKRIYHEPPDYS